MRLRREYQEEAGVSVDMLDCDRHRRCGGELDWLRHCEEAAVRIDDGLGQRRF